MTLRPWGETAECTHTWSVSTRAPSTSLQQSLETYGGYTVTPGVYVRPSCPWTYHCSFNQDFNFHSPVAEGAWWRRDSRMPPRPRFLREHGGIGWRLLGKCWFWAKEFLLWQCALQAVLEWSFVGPTWLEPQSYDPWAQFSGASPPFLEPICYAQLILSIFRNHQNCR